MRILVFQQAAWDDTNAVGNTLSNWFSNWDEDEFYNFYTRKQVPHNLIVKEYYSIAAIDIIKGLIKHQQNGRRFSAEKVCLEESKIINEHEREQRSIDKLHKTNNELVYWAMETTWRTKSWMDSKFRQFIDDTNPDILFAFCTSVYILEPLIDYVKERTHAKIVLYIADDVYGDYQRKAFYRRHYLVSLFKNCISKADMIYGVSEELCNEYGKRFGKQIAPLYKGCHVKNADLPRSWGNPLKIVYAGNLYYGREDTLGKLVERLSRLNLSETHAFLEIYTGSTITREIEAKLNCEGSSRIMGKRPYSDIKHILSEADIVLHVESFEQSQVDYVRYSFSTKIIDCLESGSLVLGIGPEELSSIRYLNRIPGVFVAKDLNQLERTLKTMLDLTEHEKTETVNRIKNFAMANHDILKVRDALRQSFLKII